MSRKFAVTIKDGDGPDATPSIALEFYEPVKGIEGKHLMIRLADGTSHEEAREIRQLLSEKGWSLQVY